MGPLGTCRVAGGLGDNVEWSECDFPCEKRGSLDAVKNNPAAEDSVEERVQEANMPVEAAKETDLVPGLAGVPAAKSSVSFIDGDQGILEYRGIRIEELADKSTFEESAYLLLFGSLPTKGQL